MIDSAAMVTASTIFVGCSIPVRYGLATNTTRQKEPSIVLAPASSSSTRRETMMRTTTTQRTERTNVDDEDEGRTTSVFLRNDLLSSTDTDTTSVL